MAFSAVFWCRNENNDKLDDSRLKIQLEDVIGRGLEAFASNDLYNAEIIFSSFFDKTGNEINAFKKINYYQMLLTRSLYGNILFHKKDFQKAEIIWRPIFKNISTMNNFISSKTPQKDVLLSYVTILKAQENIQEISKIFDLCYHENGEATEILQKFGDSPLLRTTIGEFFFHQNEYGKVVCILQTLFKNPELLNKLSYEQQALARWYYGYSLICENKEEQAEIELATFFDDNMQAIKSFETLSTEYQISCRVQYARLLLKENNSEKIVKLLGVLFDKNDELISSVKDSHFRDILTSIYGYVLYEQGKYLNAKKVLNRFLNAKNKLFIKNFSTDEIDLLTSLCSNINHMSVRQW